MEFVLCGLSSTWDSCTCQCPFSRSNKPGWVSRFPGTQRERAWHGWPSPAGLISKKVPAWGGECYSKLKVQWYRRSCQNLYVGDTEVGPGTDSDRMLQRVRLCPLPCAWMLWATSCHRSPFSATHALTARWREKKPKFGFELHIPGLGSQLTMH